jgi:hypothetical protein
VFSIPKKRWTDFAIIGASAVVVMIAAAGIAHWKFGSFSQAATAAANHWIWISPDKLDLGNQPIGRRIPFAVSVVNRSGNRVRLISVEASCTCIRTAPIGSQFPIDINSGTELEVPFAIVVANTGGKMKQVIQFVIDLGAEQRRLRAEVVADPQK